MVIVLVSSGHILGLFCADKVVGSEPEPGVRGINIKRLSVFSTCW